jgi:hypothetical protein
MRRSNLSLITAAIVFVCAVIFLMLRLGQGVVWMAIGAVWLVTAGIQRMRLDDVAQPYAGRRLVRRFSRLLLFWC